MQVRRDGGGLARQLRPRQRLKLRTRMPGLPDGGLLCSAIKLPQAQPRRRSHRSRRTEPDQPACRANVHWPASGRQPR
jgi:hypothetical protein